MCPHFTYPVPAFESWEENRDIMISGMIWMTICLVFIAIDIFVPGFAVFLLGLSAAFTSILCITHTVSVLQHQILAFIFGSVALLSIWFVQLRKWFPNLDVREKRNQVISGIRGRVVETIGPEHNGEIVLFESFHGITRWKAESVHEIPPGIDIVVVEARGLKLVVKKDERQGEHKGG